MPTSAAVAVGTLPTSGTVDFTVSGFGAPTAAIFFVSNANPTNNPQADAGMGMGFWVPASGAAGGVQAENGVGTSNAARGQQTSTAVVYLINKAGSAAAAAATASSITDGLRLSVSANDYARYVSCVLIKGTTNAYIGTHNLGTTTAVQDITAPGFKPNFLAMFSIGDAGSGAVHSILSMGFAHNSEANAISQGMVCVTSNDNAAVARTSVYVDNAYLAAQFFQESIAWKVAASDFDASGFSLQSTANSGNDTVSYLALQMADADDAWVGVVDSKASTGTQAYTGTGFTPQAVGIAQTMATAVQTATENGSLAVGVADASRQRCLDYRDDDAADPMAADSLADLSNIVHLRDDGGTDDAIAALSSFDSNGFTLNYSDGTAAVRKWLAFAIGDSTAGGSTYTLSAATFAPGSITATGVTPRVTVTVS